MRLFRRRLRLFAAAWLVFQATSLSALVPRACCLAHDAHLAALTATATTDEQVPVSHCAKPAGSATANSPHAAHHHTAPPAESKRHECAIRGTCGGPAAALFSVISTEGVLVSSVTAPADFPPAGAALVSHDQLIRQFETPDSPPPRA
jgi:hypothetical protein